VITIIGDEQMNNPQYDGVSTEVLIENRTYEAFFPEKHSAIEGIVCESKDRNYHDVFAIQPDFHTTCYIKEKGADEWNLLYQGPSRKFKIDGERIENKELFSILLALESPEIKNEYHKMKQAESLLDEIEAKQKELIELMDN